MTHFSFHKYIYDLQMDFFSTIAIGMVEQRNTCDFSLVEIILSELVLPLTVGPLLQTSTLFGVSNNFYFINELHRIPRMSLRKKTEQIPTIV